MPELVFRWIANHFNLGWLALFYTPVAFGVIYAIIWFQQRRESKVHTDAEKGTRRPAGLSRALLFVFVGALVGALVRTTMTYSATYGLPEPERLAALGPAALVGALIGSLLGLLAWVASQRVNRLRAATNPPAKSAQDQTLQAGKRAFLDPRSNWESLKGCLVVVLAFAIVCLVVGVLGWLKDWW
jgi:hypothetical protein